MRAAWHLVWAIIVAAGWGPSISSSGCVIKAAIRGRTIRHRPGDCPDHWHRARQRLRTGMLSLKTRINQSGRAENSRSPKGCENVVSNLNTGLTAQQLRVINCVILYGTKVRAPSRRTNFCLQVLIVGTQRHGKRALEPGVAGVAIISNACGLNGFCPPAPRSKGLRVNLS